MSAAEAQGPRTVADFADLLMDLGKVGFDFTVIGGLAVGAYAHLRGDVVVSQDLDLYASRDDLIPMLDWICRHGGRVVKHPQPRAVPVAVVSWQGKEVNILTESFGLPRPRDAIRVSREFVLNEQEGACVLIADPFDLLRNKLSIDREKDRTHVEILRAFIEEEIVEAFRCAELPRDRLRPARQYLDVLRSATLPVNVSKRLLALAQTASDFRFLASAVPTRELLDAVLNRAPSDDDELDEELDRIANSRDWPASGDT